MATKALTQDDFEEAEFVQTQTAEDISVLQADADDQINSIFSEVGTDKNEINYYFQVWRILKDQADMAFLFKGTPSDLPIMERLRDEYDGGKFHIQIYRNKKRYKRLTVMVEASKKAAVAQLVKNDMSELLKEMGRQQQDNFNMLKDTVLQMVGKPSTPQPSQIETMTLMIGLMKSMKDFASPQVAHSSAFDPEKMFDMFLKGMEMGRESGGNETGLMDIAKELIKSPLLSNLAHIAQNSPQMQHPIKNLPLSSKTPAMSMQPAQSQSNQNLSTDGQEKKGSIMQTPVLKHYLNILIQKAEKDSDPILYAEFILDNIPQSMIEENIMREDLIEYAATIDPRIKDHQEWFIDMRDHIISVLTSPDEQEETKPIDLVSPVSVKENVASNTPYNSPNDTERPGGNS